MVLLKKIMALGFFAICLSGLSFGQSKVALVIGNGNYKNSPLKNPVNDAAAVRDKLSQMDFEVIYAQDADLNQMDKKVDEFSRKISDADMALFYFSGHGVENDGINYLLPVGDPIRTERDLKRNAMDLNDIIEDCSETDCKKLVLVIDACRNNPMGKRGASRGLTVVNVPVTMENCIVFACQPGQTADDGDENHSPFTQAFLNRIGEKASFTEVFMKITGDVKKLSNGSQIPSITQNLTSPLYLSEKGSAKFDEDVINFNQGGNVVLLIVIVCILLALIAVSVIFIFKKKSLSPAAFFSNLKKSFSFHIDKEPELDEKFAGIKQNQSGENTQASSSENSESSSQSADSCNSLLPWVNLNGLLVSKCPVTVGQYKSLVNGNNELPSDTELPVTDVSWIDAVKFLNQLSLKENLEPVYDISNPQDVKIIEGRNGWRLPYLGEYKKYTGKVPQDFDNSQWHAGNSQGVIHQVGLKAANEFGLYDTRGLVCQWCWDSIEGKKAYAGGAWDMDKDYCLKKISHGALPQFKSDSLGFRAVRSI